ncbi:MAG: hypothetical protein FWE15_12195 [Actinomycetia bacterium]|nr:hypothetical protein [Actinomycetes bacterium]
MKTMWKDDFVDGLLDEGHKSGQLEDAREKLLRLLDKRGLTASEAIRGRVESCTDMGMINTWFDRAIDASSLDEVFSE